MNKALVLAGLAGFVLGSLGAAPAAEQPVVDITDFGAEPDSGEDATFALREALEAAGEMGRAKLVFPPGRYDFAHEAHPEHSRHPGFAENIDGLTIDGQGAELFFEGRTAPFMFRNCRDLTVRNLTIDWDEPLFMQGEVVETGENFFDVRVDPEFPVEGGEQVEAYQDFDPETRLPRIGGIDQYGGVTHTERMDEQLLRVHVHDWARIPEPGYWAVLRNQIYMFNAFSFRDCEDVTIENVTVHHTPGMGFVGNRTHNITLRDSAVRVPPESGRLVSANADGSHFVGCTGVIRIDNCLFERMGDDATNIKSGLFLTIQDIEDEYTLTAQHNRASGDKPDPGDRMEFLSHETLLPHGVQEVAEVEELPDNAYRVRFEAPVPSETAEGDVIGNVSRVAEAHISNVRVRDNRARGFLIQTHGAVIEDCHFENSTTGGVFVFMEIAYFFESARPRNVVVRNNTFENVGLRNPSSEGIIMVSAFLDDWALAPEPGVIRDVTIEDNTIRGGNSSGIFVAATDNIAIRGNTITGTCVDPHRPDMAGAVYIMSSREVTLEDNTARLEEQGERCDAALLLGPGNELDTFRAEGNTGFSLEEAKE